MEKQVFSEQILESFRRGFDEITAVLDTVTFDKKVEAMFEGWTNDMIVQVARAEIKFLSTAAFTEVGKRGITLEGWRKVI